MAKKNKKTDERRQFKRFYAKDRTFAVIRSKPSNIDRLEKMTRGEIAFAVFKSKPVKMGQIIEISEGGLSFSYIDGEKEPAETMGIDILFADENFYISQLPFKTVAEEKLENELSFTPITMKRRSVKFKELTNEQKFQLEYFLANHTTGEVIPA